MTGFKAPRISVAYSIGPTVKPSGSAAFDNPFGSQRSELRVSGLDTAADTDEAVGDAHLVGSLPLQGSGFGSLGPI